VRKRTSQAIELGAHDDVDLAPARNLHERVEAGAAFLCTAHAMVHVLVELPPSGPAVRPELFHLRGRILIGGGDARVDPGGHEPRLVGRTKTRPHGRRPPLSPFCLRLVCDLVCGRRRPHTGRAWKLRETMTKVVRLAGVEPATLGLEGRGKRELERDVTAGLPRLTRALLGAGVDSYCTRTELSG